MAMRIRFRYLSNVPKVTYGRKVKESSKPLRKPKMWAMLSIHGRRPHRKRKMTMPSSFRKAFHGFSSICQAWNSSTKRQARSPNCDPAGPTCSKTVEMEKNYFNPLKHKSTQSHNHLWMWTRDVTRGSV